MMILATIAAMAAAQSTPLQPNGKWVVDYGKDMCTVARAFGPDKITFGFRPDGFAGQGGMLVIVRPEKGGQNYLVPGLEIKLPDGLAPIPVHLKSYFVRNQKSRVVTMIVNTEELERLKSAASFAVPVGKREHIAIAPTGFPDALKALDKCSDDLMVGHGVPLEELNRAAIRPKAQNHDRWFSWTNYPDTALIRGEQSRTVALIAVSNDGKPTDCRIVSQAEDAFSKTTCDIIMRKGDFAPAYDAKENAIRSWTLVTVNWQIGPE